MENFKEINPVFQALLGTTFTWLLTALGASLIFFKREISKKYLDSMLSFAAGIMVSASFFSLLQPAILMGKERIYLVFLGFLSGGFFLLLIDKILPHLHLFTFKYEEEGIKTRWKRMTLLILAITIHNIPEGLAVGIGFGAASLNLEKSSLLGALSLTLGIGLQNFPEGFAVAGPLRREGASPWKAFWYGQLSALVEPIAGVFGVLFVYLAHSILPFALSFAAGAMVYVVVEELIPEAQKEPHSDLSTISILLGFTIMMFLDVVFS